MKNKLEKRSPSHRILLFVGFLLAANCATAKPESNDQTPEILVRRNTPNGQSVPKILKLTRNGPEEVDEPTFTLKSDPVKVQSDFKTVDISILNKQRDKEHAKKLAIIQKDLQSRIKISDPGTETETTKFQEVTEQVSVDPQEIIKKHAMVKEDIGSRLLLDDGFLGFRQEKQDFPEKVHYPVKRSDDDYYEEEASDTAQRRDDTEEPEKEEGFFSILGSIFGDSSEKSETKKKAKPEDDVVFEHSKDENFRENLKTVGDILKPLKPIDEPEPKIKNVYVGYQEDQPESRIVNNFHSGQSQNAVRKSSQTGNYSPEEPKPSYSFYKPVTEKPFRPYIPHSTNRYDDYDLEEFLDKSDSTTRVKYVSPVMSSNNNNNPNSATVTATSTVTVRTTTKDAHDTKLKFPSVQKKNDYIVRNRYQEVKPEVVTEKAINRTVYSRPETTSTLLTTAKPYTTKPPPTYYETKVNEIRPQKIHESPNFYNLINLPVRYSTKDTAIPLISTSYANTKIQGMGAHKYEKGVNGKYPNHKYDQVTVSTKRPNYWATKRTESPFSSEITTLPNIINYEQKTTKKYDSNYFDKVDIEKMQIGLGLELGGYGSKTETETRDPSTTTTTPTTSFTTPTPSTTTTKTQTSYKETATNRLQDQKLLPTTYSYKLKPITERTTIRLVEKTTEKPIEKYNEEEYEEYENEYDAFSAPAQSVKTESQNYPSHSTYMKEQQYLDFKTKNQFQSSRYETTLAPKTEPEKPGPDAEYEYYDYDSETQTPIPTTTTTKKYTTTASTTTAGPPKIRYPNLSKDKIKSSSSEKVAVVVPSKDNSLYSESSSSVRPQTVIMSSVRPTTARLVTTTSTTTTTTPRIITTTTTTTTEKPQIISVQTEKIPQFYQPNVISKDPAPVTEEEKILTTKLTPPTTKLWVQERPKTTTAQPLKPMIVTSLPQLQHQDSNVNIVLVPNKETLKNVIEQKYSQPEPVQRPVYSPNLKPSGQFHSGFEYTTEFTVGVVHGHVGSSRPQFPVGKPQGQGHFIASSVSTNPYGDDEPFRPIPKPTGISASFQVAHEDVQLSSSTNPKPFQNKHPVLAVQSTEEPHEPHEFIPSPQFHRPVPEQKPSINVRPGDIDYDFEGIQTRPKPEQYVIFSKPQLNPELNVNQLKKAPEIISTQGVTNIPHFIDKGNQNQFQQETQNHVIFNPKEGQFYQSGPVPKPIQPETFEKNRPNFSNSSPEKNLEELPLELVPPRGIQTEKPFEGNYVVPEGNQDVPTGYPRPHWEKNGKPSFLMNKNDLRPPFIPPQMAPTLVPPSNIPPQRFRRPMQPHMPPMRKNFNEGGSANVKVKQNLPNILPQFRPNTKVGSGPYHRPPPGYHLNRRNGMNRYREKEQGSFPYHIQHPDKEIIIHREHEMPPEIVPKFITNRGKLPSELWNGQGMQKRFGQSFLSEKDNSEVRLQPPESEKVLKRLERTPVTTLQMLKQNQGLKTQKTQISREDDADPSEPLIPPIYRTYPDKPETEENLYIVYPSKAPQKLYSDNSDNKVFIVSGTKSQHNQYNFTKATHQQYPLLHPYRKGNPFSNKPTNDFPYGFVKPTEEAQHWQSQRESEVDRKDIEDEEEEEEEEEEDVEEGEEEVEEETQHVLREPPSNHKDEKIDMNLHLQSNNQWNEVRGTSTSKAERKDKIPDHYRFSESQSAGQRLGPPSEYQTSIKDDKDSIFTLGAVMHTVPNANRKGQVASVPLHAGEKLDKVPQLKINERISNGKIITVSMPLDVKEEPKEENREKYDFQAPFHASSSEGISESHPTNQGWKVVKNAEEDTDTEDKKVTTESLTTRFNFENFKPELIGGFKPIFEVPLLPKEDPKTEEPSERNEKAVESR